MILIFYHFLLNIHTIIVFLLNFFIKMKYFQFRFPKDLDIPNVIHLIYPLILIVIPYLFRLWHRILILTSLPALFLLFSICVN